MQQREQLILKKLAEAREAQASTLTRFIQAHSRVTQVEARLQAVRARLEAANPPPADAPAVDTDLAVVTESAPAIPWPAPIVSGSVQISSETPAFSPTWESTTPTDPASQEQQIISEAPTTFLKPASLPASDEFEDEEDTRKQPAISLARPSPASSTPRPAIDEEETLLLTHAELREAASQRESQKSQAETQATQTAEEATDITTKIPVIRRERHPSQERP